MGASEMVPGVARSNFPVPRTIAAWEKRRESVRRKLWRLLGDLPPRPSPLDVRLTQRRQRREGFVVERFEFDNRAGAIVPGYICLPEQARDRPSPAVLYCHQHADRYDTGREEIFERWPVPRPPAVELARRGFVVLAIDAYCFGERSGKGPLGERERGAAEEMTMSKLNLWLGRTLWGMIVRDDMIALDYLCSRPEVDPTRIGVTGMSMGSTRSWWLAALDDRPAAVVCVACLTRYQDLVATGELRAHGIYYYVPAVLRHFDTEAVVSLIAPRPLLTQTGDRDTGSPLSGVEKINSFVRRVYELYGKGERFRGLVYRGVGHEYTAQMWRETLEWFDLWLKAEPTRGA